VCVCVCVCVRACVRACVRGACVCVCVCGACVRAARGYIRFRVEELGTLLLSFALQKGA